VKFYPNGRYEVEVNLSKNVDYFMTPGFRPNIAIDSYTVHGAMLRNIDDSLNIIEDGDAKEVKNYTNTTIAAASDRYYTTLFYSFDKPFETVVDKDANKNPILFVKASENLKLGGYIGPKEHKILSSQTQNWQDGVNHIAYSKMDLVLIVPASVNTINKLTAGICDNIFMQTLIAASHVPLVVAPAANNNMIEHFATQNSLEILKKNGALIVEPVLKTLACGDVGKGGLANLEVIVEAVIKRLSKPLFAGKKVVITGGATTEKIDDVRAITNFSSGKMARALARAFYYVDAEVKLLASFEVENEPFEILNRIYFLNQNTAPC